MLKIVAVAAAYAASGKLGLHFAFATRSVTAIWPPTGIALAALVLGGYRLWPAVALGALLTNVNTGVPAVTVLGIVVGNTLEALTGAFLLRRVGGFDPGLDRVRDVISLVVFGAVISTVVSATIGVMSLLIGGVISWASVPSLWRTWWLGDVGGDLIVAPAVLIAANYRRYRQLPGRPIEGVILAGALTGVSVLVFSHPTNVVYSLFPLLIWSALRFWQPGAAAASLLTGTVAVAFTAHGKGPFAMSGGPDVRLLLAQTFVAVLGVTALVLAAVTSERRRAEEAERDIAETLQRSLLPDAAPAVSGWEIATLYRPAGPGEVQVGGDFYDFFATPDGWIVIIGDVAGKGVPAAAMAGLVRHGARFISQAESRPAEILARLDAALREQPTVSLCSALCIGVHANHLMVSSAGHPGPLVVRRDGRIREIGGAGPLLGLPSGGTWPELTVPVGPDETVLLYTDGVTDTRGKIERFGEERLIGVMIEHADQSPDVLLDELEAALDGFQLGPPSDDTAALALRLERSPGAGRTRSRFAVPRVGVRVSSHASRFSIETALTGEAAVIKLAGELDHAASERLAEVFEKTSHSTHAQLIVDLAEVTFVDSAGLRALIGIERAARERDVSVRTVSPPEHVRAVFRLSGVEPLGTHADHPVDEPCDLDYPERVALELTVSDQAPRQARAEVREAIAGRVSQSESEVAVLITSELVTNAVVHPVHREGASIGLRIGTDEGRVRVEVSDSGRGFEPGELTQDENAVGGRGLVVVDRGATRWGTSNGDGRFSVWFELGSHQNAARVIC